MSVESIITENLDVWTSAIKTKSASGRGSSKKLELYGIKKLRELILDLAVRGKLVHQDPSDEPASLLLEGIKAQKAALIKDKLIRKPKALPSFSESDVPYELPESWSWTYLQDVTSYIQRGKGPKYAEEGNVKVISQKCIQNSGFSVAQARYVDNESLGSYGEERYLKEADLLWNSTGTGTVGRVNVLPNIQNQILLADSHVTVIRPLCVQSWYLWCFISSPTVQTRIAPDHENSLVSGSTKQVELNTSSVQSLLVPVAPLEEQARIVKRVNDLMKLCDQLESQTEASIEAHKTLVKSLLETLTNAKDADELNESWQRISAHFDVLFTTEDSIDQLKQTILQLAVVGKLVKQDPNDEPASKLLERIAAEKEQLIKDKKIKKQKLLAPITDDEISRKLPNDWSWCRLNEIISIMDAGWSPACPPEPSPSSDKWGVLKTTAVQKLEFLENENKVLAESKDPKAQYEVKSGDILITRAGPRNRVGISCLVRNTRPRLMISDKIIRFHLVHSDLDEEFISLCLNSGVTAEYLEKSKSGMADSQVNISQDKLKEAPIPLAPLRQQREIVTKVYALWTLCENLKLNVVRLRNIRNCVADSFINHS